MRNNVEIRQRMETYRTILLVLNWIVASIIVISGISLSSGSYLQGIGVGVIILGVALGVLGHFLTNIALAIPFILLNNGDILEQIKNNNSSSNNSPSNDPDSYDWVCKKCNNTNRKSALFCNSCGEKK
jgi:hypothetical protein